MFDLNSRQIISAIAVVSASVALSGAQAQVGTDSEWTTAEGDIRIRANTHKERKLLDEIRRRGLTLQRTHGDGNSVRLSGPGVHVVVADLSSLSLADLQPPRR